jgi:hypothetical protein
MKSTIDGLRAKAKELPEDDPNRKLIEQTAKTLEEHAAVASEKPAGEKHFDDVQMVEQIRFMGGAVTFDEADDWAEGLEVDMSIEGEKNTFDELHRNNWNSDRTIAEKAALTLQAANDLATRIGDVETGERSTTLIEKAKTFFFGEKHEDLIPPLKSGELVVFKDVDGDTRWFAVHSNRYKDRDEEIFPTESHKEYEQYIDRTGNWPELRLWHTPGSRMGLADFISYDEGSGFMMSSGLFDKGFEDVAEKLANSEEPLACSHGYVYAEHERKGGVYDRYRSFEVTVLPAANASNPWTAITVGQIAEEVKSGMEDVKRAFLLSKLGPERTERIEAQLAEMGKELTTAGVDFKDVIPEGGGGDSETATPTETAAAPAKTTEEKPAEGAEAPAADPPATETPTASAEAPAADPPAGDGGKSVESTDLTRTLVTEMSRIINEALVPVNASIADLQGAVKSLQDDDDTKVAETMTPRTSVPATQAQRPTESGKNVMDEKAAEEATEGNKADGDGNPVNPYVQMAMNGAKVGATAAE